MDPVSDSGVSGITDPSTENPLLDNLTDAKTICIVGGGAAGLVCLKVILDTSQYRSGIWKPILFEAREQVGGIWLPAPPTTDPPLTPLYDSLKINLPHPIMAYTCYPFPPSTPVYTPAHTVQSYLKSFASHFNLLPHIRLNTTVENVDRDTPNTHWKVCISTGETRKFDYLVVANGHYRNPRYPNVPGIEKWLKSGKAIHSAWYRRPVNMGEVVLVVGGGPSGKDIAADMRSSARVVIHSAPGAQPSVAEEAGTTVKTRGRLLEFLDDGNVAFEGGVIEGDIDYCILATGYDITFDFLPESVLKGSLPPPVPPLPSQAYNSKFHVFPLMKYLFPLQSCYPPTSIAFPGLLYRVVPFPLVEAQALAMVKAWSDPKSIDSIQEAVAIVTRYTRLKTQCEQSEMRVAKRFLSFEPMEQFDYRDELAEFTYAGDSEQVEKTKVLAWHREIYGYKEILREEWKKIEQEGSAKDFVARAGEGGAHEWEGVMRRLLARALERQSTSKL